MTEMTAFERRVADGMLNRAGPIRPVDDLAIYEAVTTASRSPRWGFTMFSAVKFVAAAAIVALFGGFLLAGVFTTQQLDDMTPAAATESPSPMTTKELLAGMVTEEVEPGVYRVLNDGVRELAITPADEESVSSGPIIIAGLDGSTWLREGNRMVRLGEEDGVEFEFGDAGHPWGVETEVVTADGTIWVVGGAFNPDSDTDERRLWSYDGEKWDERSTPTPWSLAAAPDGAIWTTWGAEGPRLTRFDADGRSGIDMPEALGEAWDELAVTDDGDVWAWGGEVPLHRYDGERWQSVEMPPCGVDAVGPDGTLWCIQTRWTGNIFDQPATALYRLDGAGLQRLEVDTDSLAALSGFTETNVSPDGRLWVLPDFRGDGLNLLDGGSRTHYLQGHAVHGWDMAPDGSVWALASIRDAADSATWDLYVITPEAVE